MTCVILQHSTATPCHKCKRWVEHDVHYAEHVLWCAHCCPSCATRPPLAEGEVKPVEGEQGGLFT